MSATSIAGLVGDSIHSMSAPSTAWTTASVSATFTRSTVSRPVVGLLVEQREYAGVRVLRRDHPAADRDEIDDRRDGRHAGRERQPAPALELAERLLQRGPRVVAEPPVPAIPARDVRRAEDGRLADRRVRHPLGPAGVDDDGGRVEIRSHSRNCPVTVAQPRVDGGEWDAAAAEQGHGAAGEVLHLGGVRVLDPDPDHRLDDVHRDPGGQGGGELGVLRVARRATGVPARRSARCGSARSAR